MSTFADFALLAAVPSYGGAEILRAQRILPMGPGPRVHLAVLGRNDSVARRVIAAAHAGSAVLHPALARIFEVGRFDGVSYAVADPSEGLDLSALISRTRRPVAYELALAVAAGLGRIGVALHDAGGPGSRGGPAGFASVVSGGLALEVVFLEPTGAVRLRPLSAAGVDPDLPSAMRAPEEAISMAADVYSLGRLLMALLSGDVSGLTMPRLSSSSTLPALLAHMVQRRAEQRPHLHEAITRLEQALRERNVASVDHAVRAALQGPYRQFVVDAGLGLDASPHIIHELRMRLPYVYGAIERLWPSANPGFAPAPPVFAALAAPAVPLLGGGGDDVYDDEAPVFHEPKKRRRARTAATLRISAEEMAVAVAAADAAGPLVEAPAPRQRPTAKTVLIPTAEMIKALPHGDASPDDDDDDGFQHSGRRPAPSRPQHTVLFDEGFSSFAPPPPPPRAAPIPFYDDSNDNDPDGTTRERDLSAESVFSTPLPPTLPVKSPERRPPRPPALAALAVFDNGDDDGVEDDPELAPLEGSLFQRLQAAEAAEAAAVAALTRAKPERGPSTPPAPSREVLLPARRQAPKVEAVVAARGLLRSVRSDLSDEDNGAIDASAQDDAGFLSRSPQAPLATVVGPPPQLSEPGGASGATAPRTAVTPSTLAEEPGAWSEVPRPVARPSRVATAPAMEAPIAVEEEGDFAAAFALAFAAGPAPTSPPAPVVADNVDDLSELEEVEAIEDDVPDVIDDAAAFVMVGEAGAAFAPNDNPFDQSTRIYAAQALQQARKEVDENGEGLDVVVVVVVVDDLHPANLDGELEVALPLGSAPDDSPWAAPMSKTGAGALASSSASREGAGEGDNAACEPRTELIEAGARRLSLEEKPALGFVAEAKRLKGGQGNVSADQVSAAAAAPAVEVASERATLDERVGAGCLIARSAPSLVPQAMVSLSPVYSAALDPDEAPRTTVGSLPDVAPVVDGAVPRNVTGVYAAPRCAAATSELVVEAAVGATVALNGTVVGVVADSGRFGVEVAGDARVVVRVTLPSHAPWSGVVTVQGRPRVRVKATLQPR